MTETGGSVIKSVTRVFEVLELFEELRTPLTSINVGRRLNYPASSSLALLKSMVQLGYLSFDRIDRTYFPTVRLTTLGQWVESALHLGQSSLTTIVEAVIQATGESTSVSGQNDLDMQFVHIAQGPQHITVNLPAGTLAPLFRSTIGLVALSGRPDAEIARLAERHNKAVKAKADRVNLAEVLKITDGIRKRGYLAGYDMYITGVGAIAWLLPARDGGPGMVLSVTGPTERIRQNEDKIVRVVPPILREHGVLPGETERRRT
jgi:IclR family transcriptional regulator, KDG regulon repressor